MHGNPTKPLEVFNELVSVDKGAGGTHMVVCIRAMNEAVRACREDMEDWYLHNSHVIYDFLFPKGLNSDAYKAVE